MTLNTVLIVDDSKLARVTLRKKIQAHGLQVELAESAAEAYAILPVMQPDIIFMDHLMPDIDGFEATQHIRQMAGFEKTPIVMCSGKEHDGYLEEALAMGADYVLSKPPIDEELNTVLTALAEIINATNQQRAEVPEQEVDHVAPDLDVKSIIPATEKEFAAITTTEIESICQSILEQQRASLLVELQRTITQIVADTVTTATTTEDHFISQNTPAIDMAEIEAVCRSIIAGEKPNIVTEVLANIPEPVLPEIKAPQIDKGMINKTVEEAFNKYSPIILEDLRQTLEEKLVAQIATEVAKQSDSAIDQDMQGILDLRINVMLTKKFSEVDKKLQTLELSFSEQINKLKVSYEEMGFDANLVLEKDHETDKGINQGFVASKGIESQLDQMIERQAQLTKTLRVAKLVAIGAFMLSVAAALGVVTFYLQ